LAVLDQLDNRGVSMTVKATKRSQFSALLLCILALTAGCAQDAASTYKPGVYTGTANGFFSGSQGIMTVSVTFSEEEITDVTIVSHRETINTDDVDEGAKEEAEKEIIPKVKAALALIPKRILETQSATVDAVSGASETSISIMRAVKNCIAQASN
jgi:uncharacterized protein with FMN-binding domain